MPAYHLLVVAGRTTLQLSEIAGTPGQNERRFVLSVDGKKLGDVQLMSWYTPGVALHGPMIFVWGGARLFRFQAGEREFLPFEHDEEIGYVYQFGDCWCLVGEISIALFDEHLETPKDTYSHNEVFTRSWWEAEQLYVEDFEGLILRFDLEVGLTPHKVYP